ncbi:uncharacterized protein [Dysidea avara]|uniref:uncharacterized protein isoform X1 n=1 Tax=Dysidea avara TaxID=196820 RepID=UPI00332EC3AF
MLKSRDDDDFEDDHDFQLDEDVKHLHDTKDDDDSIIHLNSISVLELLSNNNVLQVIAFIMNLLVIAKNILYLLHCLMTGYSLKSHDKMFHSELSWCVDKCHANYSSTKIVQKPTSKKPPKDVEAAV